MEKTFLSLIFAAFLGVTLMLAPLTLPRTSMEAVDEIKPETPKSANFVERDYESAEKAEVLTAPTAPIVRVYWLEVASIVAFGAIPAAIISIIIKRKLGV